VREAAFKGCEGLESFAVAETANLVRIEKEAFSECRSLRSFSITRNIEFIGENCFKKCFSLRRLRFVSGESLKKLMGDSTIDDVLETVGLGEISILMKVEIKDDEMTVDDGGGSSVRDPSSHLTLVQDIA
jgi:hypothetical protein